MRIQCILNFAISWGPTGNIIANNNLVGFPFSFPFIDFTDPLGSFASKIESISYCSFILLSNKRSFVSESKYKYSTLKSLQPVNINPWFVTGFLDGEGCFMIYIRKNSKYSTGWAIQLVFKMVLHKKDIDLLDSIQKFFGVGKIYLDKDTVNYQVFSNKDLKLIIDHPSGPEGPVRAPRGWISTH